MATRKAISNKFYLDAEGNRSNSPTADSVIVGFEFYTGERDEDDKNIVGSTQTIDTRELQDGSRVQAMCHGIGQKVGDEWSGKGDQAEEICLTMFERLTAGEWNMPKGAGAGPRPSMVLDAVIAVLVANGVDDSEDLRKEVGEKLGEEGARKAALGDPAINAEFLKLKALSAAARANKAAAKAADAGESTFLAGLTA